MSSIIGDYLVSSQGPLPSPITQLDTTAEGYGKECVKYLMMTPSGEMMCRDKTGKIVATTIEDLLLPVDNVSLKTPKLFIYLHHTQRCDFIIILNTKYQCEYKYTHSYVNININRK